MKALSKTVLIASLCATSVAQEGPGVEDLNVD
jgi:hypothetical protein